MSPFPLSCNDQFSNRDILWWIRGDIVKDMTFMRQHQGSMVWKIRLWHSLTSHVLYWHDMNVRGMWCFFLLQNINSIFLCVFIFCNKSHLLLLKCWNIHSAYFIVCTRCLSESTKRREQISRLKGSLLFLGERFLVFNFDILRQGLQKINPEISETSLNCQRAFFSRGYYKRQHEYFSGTPCLRVLQTFKESWAETVVV